MGNCNATNEEELIHRKIETLLKEEKTKVLNEIKMLLLGTGDSGKSTVAKQMKLIYLQGFDNSDKTKWKKIIDINVISYGKILVSQMEKFGLQFKIESNKEFTKLILTANDDNETCSLSPELANAIQTIWGDESIQETFSRNAEYQISDSAPYFLTKAKEFSQKDYQPTNDDILRARVKTTGIVEVEFSLETEVYKMVDVGGQRSERKKWIHCFQDVNAIIFVASLSEYNLLLEENGTTNRMHESIKLFDDIINNVWFVKTNIILFLNKMDLFEEKNSEIFTSGLFSRV